MNYLDVINTKIMYYKLGTEGLGRREDAKASNTQKQSCKIKTSTAFRGGSEMVFLRTYHTLPQKGDMLKAVLLTFPLAEQNPDNLRIQGLILAQSLRVQSIMVKRP